jgi:hypothetical protein
MNEIEDRHHHHQEVLRLERALDEERRREHARAGRAIWIGALMILFGVAVTAVTHAAAVGVGGGRYLVAYGPIVAGAFLVFRGLVARST